MSGFSLTTSAAGFADSVANAATEFDELGENIGPDAGAAVLPAVKPPIYTGRLASTVHVLATPHGFGLAAGGERAPDRKSVV